VEQLGIHQLEEVLLECQRVINSMHATQLRAMAAIAGRDGGEYKSEQVGLLLKWSPNRAADRVCLAEKVVDRLPASLAALERGEIDLYKVQTAHELTMNLSPEHARLNQRPGCPGEPDGHSSEATNRHDGISHIRSSRTT
jgi:hypothetical protein